MINLIRRIFGKKKEEIRKELPHVEMKVKDRTPTGSTTTTATSFADAEDRSTGGWNGSTSKPNSHLENMKTIMKQTPVMQTYESIKHIKEVFGKSISKPPAMTAPPPPPKRKGGPKKAAY